MITDITVVLHSLGTLSLNSNREIAYVAQKTCDYTYALTNKHISKPEFDDLMADLKVDEIVATDADEQNAKTALASLMSNVMSLMALASLV